MSVHQIKGGRSQAQPGNRLSTTKQRTYVIALCEQTGTPVPDLSSMSKLELGDFIVTLEYRKTKAGSSSGRPFTGPVRVEGGRCVCGFKAPTARQEGFLKSLAVKAGTEIVVTGRCRCWVSAQIALLKVSY